MLYSVGARRGSPPPAPAPAPVIVVVPPDVPGLSRQALVSSVPRLYVECFEITYWRQGGEEILLCYLYFKIHKYLSFRRIEILMSSVLSFIVDILYIYLLLYIKVRKIKMF